MVRGKMGDGGRVSALARMCGGKREREREKRGFCGWGEIRGFDVWIL